VCNARIRPLLKSHQAAAPLRQSSAFVHRRAIDTHHAARDDSIWKEEIEGKLGLRSGIKQV
jgi:hypothetical protein